MTKPQPEPVRALAKIRRADGTEGEITAPATSDAAGTKPVTIRVVSREPAHEEQWRGFDSLDAAPYRGARVAIEQFRQLSRAYG